MNVLKKYPVWASLSASLAFFFAAWPVFTRKTIPEAVEPLLGNVGPPLYYAALLALGVLVALLQIAIIGAVRAEAPKATGLTLEDLRRMARDDEQREKKRIEEAMALPSVHVPSAVGGRALVTTTTPYRLAALFEQHAEHRATEHAAPYLGKWFRIQGAISDIGDRSLSEQVDGLLRSVKYHVITLSLDPQGEGNFPHVRLLFALDQASYVSHFDKGQTIAVEARLKSVERHYVTFADCELVTPV